jgi:alkylation response protein AidB-like acyl-CoA dehydrogenase
VDRNLYDEEHESFRKVVTEFARRVVEPQREAWDEAGIIGRDAWLAAGRQGIVGRSAPEEFGRGVWLALTRSGVSRGCCHLVCHWLSEPHR